MEYVSRGEPVRHVELYTEFCNRGLSEEYGLLPHPFSEDERNWQETALASDTCPGQPVDYDGDRLVVHDCNDGEGFFWSCGGYYESAGGEGEAQLMTAFAYSGEWSELFVFWTKGEFAEPYDPKGKEQTDAE